MAKGTKRGFEPEPGTLIQATHRHEDLIPAFTQELFLLRPSVARYLQDEYKEVYAALAHPELGDLDPADQDAPELVDTLFIKLDEAAPDGYYFGAHPGNGSDFGFWEVEDDA